MTRDEFLARYHKRHASLVEPRQGFAFDLGRKDRFYNKG